MLGTRAQMIRKARSLLSCRDALTRDDLSGHLAPSDTTPEQRGQQGRQKGHIKKYTDISDSDNDTEPIVRMPCHNFPYTLIGARLHCTPTLCQPLPKRRGADQGLCSTLVGELPGGWRRGKAGTERERAEPSRILSGAPQGLQQFSARTAGDGVRRLFGTHLLERYMESS